MRILCYDQSCCIACSQHTVNHGHCESHEKQVLVYILTMEWRSLHSTMESVHKYIECTHTADTFGCLAPGSPAVEAKNGDTSSTDVKEAAPSTASASNLRPPITTHVLDVAVGKPGAGIDVSLHWWTENSSSGGSQADADESRGYWAPVGNSVTNNDGRSGPLLPASNHLQPGKYRVTFDTAAYLARVHGGDKSERSVFYPYAMVVFEVTPSQAGEHFHIPLLLAPYSFSTYRGS